MSDDPLALAEYEVLGSVGLTDAERWPTLDAGGRARLAALRGHPLAPQWVHEAGDRIPASRLAEASTPLPTDGWLDEHLDVATRLPAYRGLDLDRLEDFPLVTREILARDVSAFVPLDADLDRMIHGTSSGTTGSALILPDQVEEVTRTFHLMVALAAAEGVDWRPSTERMALANIVNQRQAFTYASIISTFGQATMARLNLAPAHWPSLAERNAFLVDQQPQVFSGNPTSLEALLDPQLVASLRPLALFSGAMALGGALRSALVDAYDCPVIDIYGLHETRPVAVSSDGGPFVILDRRVFVEVLDATGSPVGPGERGEIVVTAGENPLLPLVRYRTSDYGRLVEVDGRPAIADLEGREATTFLASDGSRVPSVDFTQQLQTAGVRGWTVEQAEDGAITAHLAGGDLPTARAALEGLMHQPVTAIAVDSLRDLGEGKPRRFVSRA
ncbi:MAG: CoF synthetase [Microbacteriaceae bacterium]|nr:CoF synthetase [Microbacteriaceae bacterium]